MTNQTNKTLAYQAFKGCRVSGMKYGKPFSGVVTSRRWNTNQPNTVIVHIQTDQPIEVLGNMVNSFCMEYSDTDYLADSNYIDYIDPSTYPNK
jgi:hypothetical protein